MEVVVTGRRFELIPRINLLFPHDLLDYRLQVEALFAEPLPALRFVLPMSGIVRSVQFFEKSR